MIAAMKKFLATLFEEALQKSAYSDHPLPIGDKQTILNPIWCLMTESAVNRKEKF